jgi:Holliday junction resolvasome RuvABC endonuclease subunit
MPTILGIDCSTKTIGYSIIETDKQFNNPKLIICSFIKPPKKGNRFQKIIETQNMIQKILDQYKPDIVGIEEIIQFMKGGSGAKTIIALARINTSVGLTCYNYLGHSPAMCNVMAIRHGIKLNNTFPKKEEIPQLIENILGIKFPYVMDGNKIAEESYDSADSCAVALFTIKHIKDLDTELSQQLNLTLPKKKLNKLKKERKLLQQEYRDITGNEYTRSI